jgi:type IV pilus assembly protein PilQ
LNKQKAQILIGAQKGYVSTTVTETSTTQSVEFLEVGTQLRLRPFISSDGMIRMEVHPELSTGEVLLRGDFTLPEKEVTEVTTNIMCQDGRTIIIGGLIREELATTASQIPLLGSLPYVGRAFRQQTEKMERREIIVLITPRIIYEPSAGERGDKAAREFHHHQAVYADSMSPISKRALGRRYFRRAQLAWEGGDGPAAMRMINKSIMFDPQRRAAIDLRSDIVEGNPHGDHTAPLPVPHPYQSPLDGERIAPWLLDRLGDNAPRSVRPHHPVDPGKPGPIKQLTPQGANR